MQIKQVHSSDLSAFRGMNALFADAFEDAETYLSNPPSDADAKAVLDNPHFIALTAVEDGALIGALAAYVLPKFEQARSEIYIYDLAVRETHRRQGVATALIEGLYPFAAKHKAWVIYVQADLEDEPAVALYEKMGSREDVLHFDIMPPAKAP